MFEKLEKRTYLCSLFNKTKNIDYSEQFASQLITNKYVLQNEVMHICFVKDNKTFCRDIYPVENVMNICFPQENICRDIVPICGIVEILEVPGILVVINK